MKKILIIAAVVALGTVASYAQGLVSIGLNSGALVSTNTGGATPVTGKAFGSAANGYLYELLWSANLALPGSAANVATPSNLALWTDSTVSGVSGATAISAGKITSGTSVAATGWTAPGSMYDNERSYIIVGWSANEGANWTAVANLINGPGLIGGGYFGSTPVSFNYAGGGTLSLPAVNLWGNQTGTGGFGTSAGLVLNFVPVPEPGTMALAALGGTSLLLFRRRK